MSDIASYLGFLSAVFDSLTFESLEIVNGQPCMPCMGVSGAIAAHADKPVPREVAAYKVARSPAVMARIASERGVGRRLARREDSVSAVIFSMEAWFRC